MKGQKTSVNDAGDSIVGLPGPESTVRPDAVVLTIVVKLQEVCALTFVLNMKMMTSMIEQWFIPIRSNSVCRAVKNYLLDQA